MSKLEIFVYPTYVSVKCDRITGKLGTSNISIKSFLNKLTEYSWNYRLKRWDVVHRFCKFDYETSMVSFPRHALDAFLKWFDSDQYVLVEVPIPVPPNISVKMKRWSKRDKRKIEDRDNQVDLIEFMSDPETSFKALEASTGIGKTYTSIKAALSRLGFRTLIQSDRLTDMWVTEILDKTNLTEKDIFLLKGRTSVLRLAKIAQSGNKRLFPKCIIASQRTLAMWASADRPPYNEMPSLNDTLIALEIGVMIVDEVHMAFHTNTMISLSITIPHNIFLSATYERSDPSSNAIFNLVFPVSIRYGGHHATKYTDVYVYNYTLGWKISGGNYNGREGYMQSAYEEAICKNPSVVKTLVHEVLKPIIQAHYTNIALQKERLLILVYRTKLAILLQEELSKLYPEKTIITFLGGDSDDKYVNEPCDWVISTLKSFGTGRDLKHLITAIQLTSFESSALAKQCVGRLRHIKDRTTIYVDLYNRDVDAHLRHIKKRRIAYQTKALNYYEGELA